MWTDLPDIPVDVTIADIWDDPAQTWTVSCPAPTDIVIVSFESRRYAVCGREWRNLISTYGNTLESEPERAFYRNTLKKLSL